MDSILQGSIGACGFVASIVQVIRLVIRIYIIALLHGNYSPQLPLSHCLFAVDAFLEQQCKRTVDAVKERRELIKRGPYL